MKKLIEADGIKVGDRLNLCCATGSHSRSDSWGGEFTVVEIFELPYLGDSCEIGIEDCDDEIKAAIADWQKQWGVKFVDALEIQERNGWHVGRHKYHIRLSYEITFVDCECKGKCPHCPVKPKTDTRIVEASFSRRSHGPWEGHPQQLCGAHVYDTKIDGSYTSGQTI